MVKSFLIFLLVVSASAFSLEKLDECYLVRYGNEQAPLQIVKFYSFMCPHCVELFKRDFQQIKSQYIDTNKIAYIFHPIPKDILTVCAMDCLEKLDDKEKQAFLEVMLQEIAADQPSLSIELMKKAMEIFKKPIPSLQERSYLQETKAFHSAFAFIAQEQKVLAVPTAEVNGKLYPKDVPDLLFIEKMLRNISHVK